MTPDELLALMDEMRALATAHPDAVYEQVENYHTRCMYSRGRAGDGEGCLVGQAARNVGIAAGSGFDSWDEEGDGGGITALSILNRHFGAEYQFELLWIDHVQDRQDRHVPWGRAVLEADTLYIEHLS